MIRILAFLAVFFLALPVFAQTARETLKSDPAIVAATPNLTEAEFDAVVDRLKHIAELDAKAKERDAALKRIERMLKEDARLKADLMSE